jgi:hypothetical protein
MVLLNRSRLEWSYFVGYLRFPAHMTIVVSAKASVDVLSDNTTGLVV